MNIHIDKKVAILMILSLLIGGAIGGAIGFAAGGEEGGHEHEGYEMRMNNGTAPIDDHADGETNDDQGGLPNQDEQMNTAPAASPISTTPQTQTVQ